MPEGGKCLTPRNFKKELRGKIKNEKDEELQSKGNKEFSANEIEKKKTTHAWQERGGKKLQAGKKEEITNTVKQAHRQRQIPSQKAADARMKRRGKKNIRITTARGEGKGKDKKKSKETENQKTPSREGAWGDSLTEITIPTRGGGRGNEGRCRFGGKRQNFRRRKTTKKKKGPWKEEGSPQYPRCFRQRKPSSRPPPANFLRGKKKGKTLSNGLEKERGPNH